MKPIAEQLKSAREAKKLSLTDIAAQTRINRRFLEAIEEGNLSIIPQAYVRSFIRAFAQAVDVNADEIFRDVEKQILETTSEAHPGEKPLEPSSPAEEIAAIIAEKTGEEAGREKKKKFQRQDFVRALALFGLLMAVVFIVSRFNTADKIKKVEDIPFEEVVKENDAVIARKDSLRLSATATDSVWLIIKIDGKQTVKSTLAKNEKASWSAKLKFSVTTSDAGKVLFTMNNHYIGTLGKEGTIARNMVLDKKTLKTGAMKEEKEEKEETSGGQ